MHCTPRTGACIAIFAIVLYKKRMNRLRYLQTWALAHERALATAGLFLGFIWDNLTASRPDQIFTNVSLISYFLFAAVCIVLINRRGTQSTIGPVPTVAILQFAFGNLSSALLVLYGHSGTFLGSGLFLTALLGFLVANEFLRSRYVRTHIQIATWAMLFLSYAVIFVPVFLGVIGDWVFLLSVAVGAAAVALLIVTIWRGAGIVMKSYVPGAIIWVVAIFSVFVVGYFTNAIPPVPLSATHLGVYHDIERTTVGDYQVTYETAPWWQFWNDTNTTFSYTPGAPVYCFSAVFAPTGLTAPIFHRWEKRVNGEWETRVYLSFPINGGRDAGYRGYSLTYRIDPGEWRCSVETERGALIGRFTFDVVPGTPVLVEGTY